MGVMAAFRDGVSRVARAPWVLGGAFLVTLLVALPLSLALRGMLESHLGASLAAEAAARGANFEWWQEFSAQATGLGTTFVPSIIGFGAVLQNLNDLLDNVPLAATVAGVTAAWLVLWAFLSGGILDRFARNRATRASGFFGACGAHFPALLRLGLLSLIAYWLLFTRLHPLLLDDVFARATRQTTVERQAFFVRVALYAVFGLALIVVNVLVDYARVRIVVEDRRSALAALLAGLRFVRRQAAAVVGLYLLNGLCFVALLGIYALVAPGAVAAGPAMWLALLVGELYVVGRHFLKLTFYASEISLFQSRLAHAAYTAAPPVVWPESPSAEMIGNAAPSGRG